MWFVSLFLAALGVLFSAGSIAAFISLNPAAPGVLRFLSVFEGLLLSQLNWNFWGSIEGFWRGSLYILAATLCMALSAWVKPRRAYRLPPPPKNKRNKSRPAQIL